MLIISLGKYVAHLEDLHFYNTLMFLSCIEILLQRRQKPLMKHFFAEVFYERNITSDIIFEEVRLP